MGNSSYHFGVDEPLIELCTVQTQSEGQLVIDLLMEGGVPAVLQRSDDPARPGAAIPLQGNCCVVLVAEGDFPDAQLLLEDWQVRGETIEEES